MASSLARTYLTYLQGQNLEAHIDLDGDVVFKVGNFTYYIDIDSDDREFLRIVFPHFREIRNRKDLVRAIEIAHAATRKTKVAKVWVSPDNQHVSASIELFLPHPENIESVFPRALAALMTAVKNFITEF